ncbi:maleylpyruvate isomerase family mycothiol-dependent enzyme [Streptomyces sp. NPDC014733]|uniref:maleylpyruvate isomerase family mycothiol-dependent enzyme n=1 Tax=Streptomyces sp. NPDC014733 TaxID=3364885 RepID=UPI0036F9F699
MARLHAGNSSLGRAQGLAGRAAVEPAGCSCGVRVERLQPGLAPSAQPQTAAGLPHGPGGSRRALSVPGDRKLGCPRDLLSKSCSPWSRTALTPCTAASRAPPHLGVRVPSCPGWSLRDLVAHLAQVHRFWAAAVVAGPNEKPPTVAPADDTPSANLAAESAAATQELIAALRAAGPAAGCWTWWSDSDVPMTSGAVARHQLREAAVHAFDAQLATGAPLPIPADIALDGIAEFIGVGHGTAGPWPHKPTRIGLHAAEGESWLVDLTASGSHVIDGQHKTAADLHGSASDLLLTLHGRLPLDSQRSQGARATLENFLRWPDLG